MISQNGWSAGERTHLDIVTVTVPGTKTKLPVRAGNVATVLLWVATRWHNEIEPLVEPGNWGYAYRAVRGATSGLSNHASGTAIDLNAPAHPLGTDPSQTMSKAQVAAAKRIEADSGGVVRWGGSYTGRKDPMHWEINAPADRVAALAARIRAADGGTPDVQEDELMAAADDILAAIGELSNKIGSVQSALIPAAPNDPIKTDGEVTLVLRKLQYATIPDDDVRTRGEAVVAARAIRTLMLDPARISPALGSLSGEELRGIAAAVNDEADRRKRDGDPATGPTS